MTMTFKENLRNYFNKDLKATVNIPGNYKVLNDYASEEQDIYTLESPDNRTLRNILVQDAKLLASVKERLLELYKKHSKSVENINLIFEGNLLKIKYITKLTGNFGEYHREIESLIFNENYPELLNYLEELPSEFFKQENPLEYILKSADTIKSEGYDLIKFILNLDDISNDDKMELIYDLNPKYFSGEQKVNFITFYDINLRNVDDLIYITYEVSENSEKPGNFSKLLKRQKQFFEDKIDELKHKIIYNFMLINSNDEFLATDMVIKLLDRVYSIYGGRMFMEVI